MSRRSCPRRTIVGAETFSAEKVVAGLYQFRLVDDDRGTIAISKGYLFKQACLYDIGAVKEQVPDAEIDDKTAFLEEN
jgi:uncharacterized protein YegP (UPF0339 family)